ncbi:hypothetical protein FISHEDRAFT_22582, partial [Fistulina hepatica ATCC 64428]
MVDWSSSAELAIESDVFTKFMHAIFGLYVWEWMLSLDFDWEYISGRKRFRWPMIFYFANRYILLGAMIGIVVALDVSHPINCKALYTFNQLAGDAALGLASINLSLRTIAVWSHNKIVIGVLVVVILGHWSLILQGVLLNAAYIDGACTITSSNNTVLAATFIYSMVFDLGVLVLNTWKLMGRRWSTEGIHSTRLGKMLFRDGLIYFIIAFLLNLVATVFMLLDLNEVMSVIFNVPAAVGSTIVACRVVRRLIRFTADGVEML